MRVPSGRLKAVLVATFATIILIGVIAPGHTRASDPPGLARFMAAIAHVESHGDYAARNPSGAYGKYQIMPASWRGWAARYLGDANARPTPANQEIVAVSKFRALYAWLGSWRRVAYWWLTGSSRTYGWSSTATRYVTRVMAAYRDGAGTEVTRRRRGEGEARRRRRARRPPRTRRPRRTRFVASRRRTAASSTRGPGDQHAIRGTPAVRSRTRPRPAPPRPSGSRVPRSSGTGRSARPAVRPGSGSTAGWSRPSTCTPRRSRHARRCSARRGPRRDRTPSSSRSSARAVARTSRSTSSTSAASGHRVASTSISTLKSAARAVTPTVALAGGSVGKYSR